MGAPFSFVLRITALFVICIPCKIHLICLHDGPSRFNRMILRLSTKPGKLNIIPDTLSRLFNVEHSEMRVAPHLAPICRNVPDNPALHGPPRSRPYQVNSHNLDEIQPVESYRERFTNATDVFMSIDPEKLRQAKQAEFGPYFEYLCDPKKRPPSNESRTYMSYYSENGGLLYRSYLPSHLRKRSTFRDQLVIPSACIPMVLHACHDHAMSGGHLAYKQTFDKVRDRFWWPTLHRDVKTWCQDCQACQRRKTPHRGPKLPTGHLPVDRPFQCVSIDLVEYKTESVSPTGLKCSYALTIIDHFTRFAALVALPTRKSRPLRKLLWNGYLVSSDRSRHSIPIKARSSKIKL